MTFSGPDTIPARPPAELLAELDVAARALDELTARAARLMLALDPHTRRLRIELREDGRSRELAPHQLLDLLS